MPMRRTLPKQIQNGVFQMTSYASLQPAPLPYIQPRRSNVSYKNLDGHGFHIATVTECWTVPARNLTSILVFEFLND